MMTPLTHSDGRALLPGRGVRAVALFFRSHDRDAEALIARFAAMPWPRGYRLFAVDIDAAATSLRGWLTVNEPTVVIVDDGMILAMDQRCDAESCQNLLAVARRQAENIHSEL